MKSPHFFCSDFASPFSVSFFLSFSLLVSAVSPPFYSSLPLSLSRWAWLACRLLSHFLCLSLSLYSKLEDIMSKNLRKNIEVKTIYINRYEKFLFVLNWLHWTKLLLLGCLCFTKRGWPFVFVPKKKRPETHRLPQILHWYACGVDGRAAGGRCTVTCLVCQSSAINGKFGQQARKNLIISDSRDA